MSIPNSDGTAPMSFEEAPTYSLLCAVLAGLSVKASGSAVCLPLKLGPRSSLSCFTKSKGRAFHGQTSSCVPQEKELQFLLPSPPERFCFYPESGSDFPSTLRISSRLHFVFCCFTTRETLAVYNPLPFKH